MIHYPGFNPIAFELGPVKVHWYGIMYLLGFAGGLVAGAPARGASPAPPGSPTTSTISSSSACSA